MSNLRIGGEFGRGIKIDILNTTPEDVAAAVTRLDKLPASTFNQPTKKSATKVKNLAKQYAPRKSGLLAANLAVSKKERTSKKGKIVFDVGMKGGEEANSHFVRMSNGTRYYYPASQEYGFRTKNGGRVPGKYFLKHAAAAVSEYHEQLVLDEAGKKLEKLWAKQNASTSTS